MVGSPLKSLSVQDFTIHSSQDSTIYSFWGTPSIIFKTSHLGPRRWHEEWGHWTTKLEVLDSVARTQMMEEGSRFPQASSDSSPYPHVDTVTWIGNSIYQPQIFPTWCPQFLPITNARYFPIMPFPAIIPCLFWSNILPCSTSQHPLTLPYSPNLSPL